MMAWCSWGCTRSSSTNRFATAHSHRDYLSTTHSGNRSLFICWECSFGFTFAQYRSSCFHRQQFVSSFCTCLQSLFRDRLKIGLSIQNSHSNGTRLFYQAPRRSLSSCESQLPGTWCGQTLHWANSIPGLSFQ